MAEWLRRLTRNQMGSSCPSSNLADCKIFRSPVLNTSKLNTSNYQKVQNEQNEVIPWEKKGTVQEPMTDTDKFKDSEMQSLRSAEGMRREIRWVHPAQVWIFLRWVHPALGWIFQSLDVFGPH